MKFTTVPNLVVQLHRKKWIGNAELNLTIKKLQKFGRYSDEIMRKLKEELK